MTEGPTATLVVAVIKPCEQYRYRVELPQGLDEKVRAGIRRLALQEINDRFLDCSRTYQTFAWLGASNVCFADTRHSPSDSKSEFLHLLICLKIVELGFHHHVANFSKGGNPPLAVSVETFLPQSARLGVTELCEALGLRLQTDSKIAAQPRGRVRIGGIYRSSRHAGKPFSHQPIKNLDIARLWVTRHLAHVPWLRRGVNILLRAVTFLFWPIPIAGRLIFGFYYRAAAARVMRRLDGPRNVFIYFDLRLGRNRDVGAYLRWKYGSTFRPGETGGSSCIPFTHVARPEHAYSFAAMIWAHQSLKKMEKDPLAGCVVVSYLLPASRLLEVRMLRNGQRREMRRKLVDIERQAGDFFASAIYKEFIASLDLHLAFPVEVSACYEEFFGAFAPGVVVQADAVAKTARHFTACAKRRGSRAVYVADRICTRLRTSNQFIADAGDNPHLPDRCVVFDQVSRDEFLRQGVPPDGIYSYCRNFAVETAPASAPSRTAPTQVVILLQAYEDNIGGMVRLGEEIARNHPELTILYQEHPNFPVCHRVRSGLLKEMPGRLRFLRPGQSVDFATTLALITGYSTAAVPGVLHGVPLIWLRRQIDNSIYGEAYLDRIGFAADHYDQVSSILERLIHRDPATLEACIAATAAAEAIFMSTPDEAARSLPDAIAQALNDSFAELDATAPAEASAANRLPKLGLVAIGHVT